MQFPAILEQRTGCYLSPTVHLKDMVRMGANMVPWFLLEGSQNSLSCLETRPVVDLKALKIIDSAFAVTSVP
ncbi:hypothetical protein QQP08_007391 [Theobroma cacao]|nr:hypothetical protein QQP08_007391 [Theobroma cacao]